MTRRKAFTVGGVALGLIAAASFLIATLGGSTNDEGPHKRDPGSAGATTTSTVVPPSHDIATLSAVTLRELDIDPVLAANTSLLRERKTSTCTAVRDSLAAVSPTALLDLAHRVADPVLADALVEERRALDVVLTGCLASSELDPGQIDRLRRADHALRARLSQIEEAS